MLSAPDCVTISESWLITFREKEKSTVSERCMNSKKGRMVCVVARIRQSHLKPGQHLNKKPLQNENIFERDEEPYQNEYE